MAEPSSKNTASVGCHEEKNYCYPLVDADGDEDVLTSNARSEDGKGSSVEDVLDRNVELDETKTSDVPQKVVPLGVRPNVLNDVARDFKEEEEDSDHPVSGIPYDPSQSSTTNNHDNHDELVPSALRHIHSLPGNIPPPIPFNSLDRSSSTPLSFRREQSFGTESSAFSLPAQKLPPSSSNTSLGVHTSAFDPVQYYARALEDMEKTSIEVTCSVDDKKSLSSPTMRLPRGAASRAAQFLSGVGVLRRKRRGGGRSGRENPAQPASISYGTVTVVTEHDSNDGPQDSTLGRSSEVSAVVDEAPEAVTNGRVAAVVEQEDEIKINNFASSQNSDVSNIVDKAAENVNNLNFADIRNSRSPAEGQEGNNEDEKKAISPILEDQYQQLDSGDQQLVSDIEEGEEEEVQYHRIEESLSRRGDSPASIPSPAYQQLLDDPPSSGAEQTCASTAAIRSSPTSGIAVTPTPSSTELPQLEGRDEISLTLSNGPASGGSPTTMRSSNTGGSSSPGGHTMQTVSTSSNTNPQSGLSVISEADREVMEANKEGRLGRGLRALRRGRMREMSGGANVASGHSSNTNSQGRNSHSPGSPREGANMPADRFFTKSPTPGNNSVTYEWAHNTTSSSPTRRSGRTSTPGNSDAGSVTRSVASSSPDEPLMFVSYLDRHAPYFASLRQTLSSQRPWGDDGERDASPYGFDSDLVGEVIYEEEAKEPFGDEDSHCQQQPESVRSGVKQRGRFDKFRFRPPRSPFKGSRPATTPPPRGSVSPSCQNHQLSPPRNIVDHPDSNISRPCVTRKGERKPDLFGGAPGISSALDGLSSSLDHSFPGAINHVSEILSQWNGGAILKADSTDDDIAPTNIVTPEKDLNS